MSNTSTLKTYKQISLVNRRSLELEPAEKERAWTTCAVDLSLCGRPGQPAEPGKSKAKIMRASTSAHTQSWLRCVDGAPEFDRPMCNNSSD